MARQLGIASVVVLFLIFTNLSIVVSAQSSNNNQTFTTSDGEPDYSQLSGFSTTFQASSSSSGFSFQDNVWDDQGLLAAQSVFGVNTTGNVILVIDLWDFQGTNYIDCSQNPGAGSISGGYQCLGVVTSIPISVVYDAGQIKTAFDYGNNTEITGAYFIIWASNGTMVFDQSYLFTYQHSDEFVVSASVLVGNGNCANATFTNLSGNFQYATDATNLVQDSPTLNGNTCETSNAAYGSISYSASNAATQSFSS